MMFSKLYKNSPVKNILVITLSNIGDVVLSAPVIDILLRDFPCAKLSLVIGERAASLFEGNPRIERIHIFDKKFNLLQQCRWTLDLRRFRYDAVIDLRNSMIGYFLTPQWLTPPSMFMDKKVHLKERHLNRLRTLYPFESCSSDPLAIAPSSGDILLVEQKIKEFLGLNSSFILMAPFAADSAKTWPAKEFAELSKSISRRLKVVMIGSANQKEAIDDIIRQAGVPVLNLAGATNLIQTAELIKNAKMVLVHDSGPMHIASYFNKPIIALFGPTDPASSSPWSSVFKVIHRQEGCLRCLNPRSTAVHTCMSAITQEDVLKAFEEIYGQI